MNKRIKKILKRNQVYLNYFSGMIMTSVGVFFTLSEYNKSRTEHLINQFEHSPKIRIQDWYYENDKGARVRDGITVSNDGYELSNFKHTLYSFIRITKKDSINCILSSRLVPIRNFIGIGSIYRYRSSGELASYFIRRQEFFDLQFKMGEYDNYNENRFYELEEVILLKATYKDYKADEITSYHCLDNHYFGAEISEEMAKGMIDTLNGSDMYEIDKIPILDFI